MKTSIRLLTAKPPSRDTLHVLLLPAGENSPLGCAIDGSCENSQRFTTDADGRSVLVLGLGESPCTASLRIAASRAAKALRTISGKTLAFDASRLSDELDSQAAGRAIAEGLSIATFDTKPYAGAASKHQAPAGMAVAIESRFHKGFREGLLIGQSINTARRLAATPPNFAGPSQMTAFAKDLAGKYGMAFRVIDAAKAAKLGMGGLVAVGQGSADAARLVILDWNPSGKATTRPILLVGKTVTYDSGGLSIKADGGKGMKADKSGGCTMLGVMEAVALKKIRSRVICILAVAENMIDSNSYRLDDIITHYNGVTCEITNTDAEGRLVLADALAWGTETYQPTVVIDAATLTGGVIAALGKTVTGAFCNNDELMARLDSAARQVDEKVWRLPLDDDLRQKMRSTIADLQNSSAVRTAQAGAGAAYLSFFIGSEAPRKMPVIPWIHLDIAGTATSEGESEWGGLFPKGPTGWGVRTLAELIANLSSQALTSVD